MLAVFSHQVLRLLHDRTLLVWTLGFPIVLSSIFMMQFSNLNETYKANPMSFGIVQGETYRVAPDLDALVEQILVDDVAPHLVTGVTRSTISEAEAATKRGDTSGHLTVENSRPVLYVTQKGDAQEFLQVLRMVMDSYARTRAKHEALIEAGTPPEQAVFPQARRDFTQPVSVTPVPIKLATRYYSALLAFASDMGTTIAMVAVQGIMATSPLGVRQTMAGLPRWKAFTATLTASWVCVLVCLLIAFAFIAMVVGVGFGSYLSPCLVAIGVASLISSAAGAALGTSGKLGAGMISAITCPLSLSASLYSPRVQSLTDSARRGAPLLAQANPLWQIPRCFYGLLYYDSPEPLARSCAVPLGVTYLFLIIALTRVGKMNHEYL